jgi:WXG100 family type VII secretion target
MAERLVYSGTAFEEFINTVRMVTENIDTTWNNISNLGSSLEAEWHGDAADAFFENFNIIVQKKAVVEETLNYMLQSVESARDQMLEADAAMADVAQSLV